MKIINIDSNIKRYYTGRMSDGSDRAEIILQEYKVKVEDDIGQYLITFNQEPSQQEIIEAYNNKNYVDITSDAKKIEVINSMINGEIIDTEKVAMAEAIIDLTNEIEEIKNKLNGGM
ncbi:hypothetical protein [Clostridium kluyveri]|uniref:hypothetical protein n=1 Tax=Clostridium kluyveri TaxID=1534 RepID=UPI0022486A2E|nr:hypothetical protein [Clostridium kluyveri]UZQ49874.1 hypothetical protein OP486_18290 [Clostridium kluyveri]